MAVPQRRSQTRRAILAVVLLALAAGGCKNENGQFYAGKINIPHAPGLSQEERAVEERFAEFVGQNPEKAIAAYRKQFGNNINVDNARELSKDYAPDGPGLNDDRNRAARAMHSDAVEEPARALANAAYLQVLKETPANDAPVVFTAGGAGSGKSTSIANVGTAQSCLSTADLIYDTTLSDANSALEKIKAALKSGRKVCIVFVYRDPVDAFEGALLRAMKEGRTLSLDAFARTHQSAPEVLLALYEQYKGNKRVEIRVVDNTRGPEQAVETDLGFVRGVTGKHKPERLKEVLSRKLDEAQASGRISQAVYLAFKGH